MVLCSCCLNHTKKNEYIDTLECGHMFHSKCMCQLIRSKQTKGVIKCPNCRREVRDIQVVPDEGIFRSKCYYQYTYNDEYDYDHDYNYNRNSSTKVKRVELIIDLNESADTEKYEYYIGQFPNYRKNNENVYVKAQTSKLIVYDVELNELSGTLCALYRINKENGTTERCGRPYYIA